MLLCLLLILLCPCLAWADSALPTLPDPTHTIKWCEEFDGGNTSNGTVGSRGWRFTATGLSVTDAAGVAGHYGIKTLTTDATISRAGFLLLGAAQQDLKQNDDFIMRWKVRINTSIANIKVLVGTTSQSGAISPTNGIYFQFDTSSGVTAANWMCESRSGGTSTQVDSAVAVTLGAWYNLQVSKFGGASGSMSFFINDAPVCGAAMTTNFGAVAVGFGLGISNLAAAVKDVDVDQLCVTIFGQ